MKIGKKIELLSPAKNLECGIEAIKHGADAVYIGAPMFSARSAAGNSIEDIKALADFAHQYYAKVYVALNTILKDDELVRVEKMIAEIYEAGADALIIQDMGILELDLPPIPLHASTQMNNRSVEKVRFLQDCGFSQVVLARELGLSEIKDIARHTNVDLEVFVHGALCVSYSGQCYLSSALSGRSANRGECAQYCRLPYSVIDTEGNVLLSNKHVLSLKDLNLSDHLEELIDAGVTSLKIEGRLKDLTYVKNITAFYRKRLDMLFEKRPEFIKASSGHTELYFVPDPNKSFNRGFTNYFLKGRNKDILSPDSPKSFGEQVGTVKDLDKNFFTYSGLKKINNGDGLCFLNEQRELEGFRVNRTEGNRIFPLEMPRLKPGIALFRNYDHAFEKMLTGDSAERKVSVDFILKETDDGFSLMVIDEEGHDVCISVLINKEPAQKSQEENIFRQLSKLGNTMFKLENLKIEFSQNWFIPSSLLSRMKRDVVLKLQNEREGYRTRSVRSEILGASGYNYPEKAINYLGNVANQKAAAFYKRHGVVSIDPAFELKMQENVPLMFTKHCIRYDMGCCRRYHSVRNKLREPLYLLYKGEKLKLKFDCEKCEMEITK